jgi:rhamnosyltransferase
MRTDQPLLTIAIPTFNRAEFLLQLLSSLHGQLAANPNVELLISDNACTDNTPAVIEEFSNRGMQMRYIRNKFNIGPDANFLQCYEEAAGKYVWVFGDDDEVLDGGLSIVVKLLQQESPDYMFVAPYVFRNSIAEIEPAQRMMPTVVINDPIKMVHLVNLHADLVLISGAIINKDRVSTVQHPPFSSLIDTNLVQLGWVFTSLRYLRRGVFVQLGVLAARAGNSRGGFQAAKVFGQNFSRAVSEMLPKGSRLAAKVTNDHLRNWFPRNWMAFRESGEDPSDQNEVLNRAFRGNLRYWICVYPVLHVPRNLAAIWAKLLRVPSRLQFEKRRTLRVQNRPSPFFQSGNLLPANSNAPVPSSVAAVVVLYNPDHNLFKRLIDSLVDRVDRIVIIDNTSHPNEDVLSLLKLYEAQLSYVPLGENMGIASAQNVGIQRAMTEGYSRILLLDQDSCPRPDMVNELIVAETKLLESGVDVAAVGPKFIDEKTGLASKAIRHGWMHVKNITVDGTQTGPVEADYLIASGSLIRMSTIAKVGGMREELFIDWVDIEWGLRARAAGSRCYIVPDAVMAHSIGDNFVRFLGKEINLHNDTRNFYIVRNATYLLRLTSMGWQWRSVTLFKIPIYVCFYSWHSGSRMKSVRLLIRAVLDGFRGRLGRLD